jgi:hypothetical protein
VHLVFSVSQLKQHMPGITHDIVDMFPRFTYLPNPMTHDTVDMFPEVILDTCLFKKGISTYLHVLVKWSSCPTTMAIWEEYKVLLKCYPYGLTCG